MKILVTGGLGFIGHKVVKRFICQEHDVFVVDNITTYGCLPQEEINYIISERLSNLAGGPFKIYVDDIRSDKMKDIFSCNLFDVVVHMASFPRQKIVNQDPVGGSSVLSAGLINLLELSKEYGVKKFVYISSSMVYGNFTDGVREDAICNPRGQYGIMKLAGEWLVKDYASRGFFTHTILRPSAVYGPLDVENRVVSKFMLTALKDKPLKVNGKNENLDFTYVDDVADGIVSATLSDIANNKTYNISRGRSVSLLDAAKLSIEIVGLGSIEILSRDPDFPSRGSLNIERAKRDIGFDPKINIDEGFNSYYTWLINSEYYKGSEQ